MATRLALFVDRDEAGRRLAASLERYRDRDPVVVAVPRGGVPVAFEVARLLAAPLDILVVRKIGSPFTPEYGIGAVAEGGFRYLRPDEIELIGISDSDLDALVAAEAAEVERRRDAYRGDHEPLPVEGRTVILIDDGIATGAGATVGARALRARGAAAVILAVPVGPPGISRRLAREFDDVVCLEEPQGFFGVGQFYAHFPKIAEEEVCHLLDLGREPPHLRVVATPSLDPPPGERLIEIEPEPGVLLTGDLVVPEVQKGSGAVRRWRRLQPQQSPRPPDRHGPERRWPRDAALRPADADRGRRTGQSSSTSAG